MSASPPTPVYKGEGRDLMDIVREIIAIEPCPPPRSNLIVLDAFVMNDPVAFFNLVWNIWQTVMIYFCGDTNNRVDFSDVDPEEMQIVDQYMNAMGFGVCFDCLESELIRPLFTDDTNYCRSTEQGVDSNSDPFEYLSDKIELRKNHIRVFANHKRSLVVDFYAADLPSPSPRKPNRTKSVLDEIARIVVVNIEASFRVEFFLL